jgi:hypothetical protein
MPSLLPKNFAMWRDHARDSAGLIFGLVLLATCAIPVHALDANQPDASQGTRSQSPSASSETPSSRATFDAARRALSNWPDEATENLDLSSKTKEDVASKKGVPEFPRCVMLNNYWCIKRARWAGEIAADAEGHVAFASAIDGAIAAAMLLRRYYLDFNRRSALAIVSRWAPPQCAGGTAALGKAGKPHKARSAMLAGLAPHGIQNTLHARWLAAHRQGFLRTGTAKTPRRSIVPSWPLALMRAPEIAVGMGEPKRAAIPLKKIAALDFAAPEAPVPGISCAGDNTRIQNYAARAIDGITTDPNGDLNLFAADGTAGANLPRLLQNMAKVEIGPWAAQAGLIAAAIGRLPPRNAAVGSTQSGEARAATGANP